MKTVIILRGESKSYEHEIVSFSMLEPSTTHIRFQTRDGQVLEAHGLTLSYVGDIDKLPPCAYSAAAMIVRPYPENAERTRRSLASDAGDNQPPCPECSAVGQHYRICSQFEE